MCWRKESDFMLFGRRLNETVFTVVMKIFFMGFVTAGRQNDYKCEVITWFLTIRLLCK